jgi:hypothetical protein
MGTPQKFKQHGKAGIWMSDAIKPLGDVADELTVIRSMKTEAIKGDKHSRKFRGTEAELKTVTAWLETQKAPKAPKAR